jgi:hypothetical protein
MDSMSNSPTSGITGLAATAALSLASAAFLVFGPTACGPSGPSAPPPGNAATAVPSHAVNDGTMGIVRIRLQKQAELGDCSAFGKWMKDNGMDSAKATYFAEQLRLSGIDTILIPIPTDERMLDDVGFWVGGAPGLGREPVEDVLIKTGGLSVAGAAAASLTVVEVGNGWYYVGISGDGTVTDARDEDAKEFSDILGKVDDCPAAIVFRTNGFEVSLDEITFESQSRLVRRLRAVAESIDDAVAIAATISRSARGELILVFETAGEAESFGKALAGIRKDMLLALEGSVEQGEVTAAEAAKDRAMIEKLRAEQRGSVVVLVAEG